MFHAAGRVKVDDHCDDGPDDAETGRPSAVKEAEIRAMLAQSTRDIAVGRIVPMARVLDRMRVTAERIRAGRNP